MSTPAFHDVLFPINYAGGTSGGPMYSTKVTSTDSGSEQRNQMWSNARRAYEIGYTADPTDMLTIINFFNGRAGRMFSFRFRDWSDWKALLEHLVAAPVMQLQKAYGDAGRTEIRLIKKPCNDGSFQLYDNGSPVGSTLDYATGLVTPTTYNAGHTYVWSGHFDTPVRFDVDRLVYVQETPSRRSLQATPVVEVLL